jgi:hypothetical protein
MSRTTNRSNRLVNEPYAWGHPQAPVGMAGLKSASNSTHFIVVVIWLELLCLGTDDPPERNSSALPDCAGQARYILCDRYPGMIRVISWRDTCG